MMTDFKTLANKVIEVQGHRTLLLSFSTGKDSLASFLRCYESGLFDNYVLYHMYMVEGLSWIDHYLDYFSKKFGIRIISVPSTKVLLRKHNVALQTPLGVAAYCKVANDFWPYFCYTYTQLEGFLKEDYDLSPETLSAVGVKENDSPLRRMAIRKSSFPGITFSLKKWYPIFDFTNKDIADIIKRHDVKLPEDYDLFGLSLDGMDHRFSCPIREKKPADFEKIKAEFPLIDLVIEKTHHYFGCQKKRGKFDYKKYNLTILK